MPLRAVTFDLWQTLILDSREAGEHRAHLRARRVAEVLRRAGVPASPEEVASAIRRTVQAMEALRAQGYDLPFPRQLDRMLEEVRPRLSQALEPEAREAVAEVYAGITLELPPPPAPRLPELLWDLKGKGLRLALISNSGITPGRLLRRLLARYRLLEPFDALLFSDEEGLAKPHPEMFRRALQALGVAPGEAVHIGDNPRADVEGALAVGMRAVLVNGKGQTPDVPVPVIPSVAEAPRALKGFGIPA